VLELRECIDGIETNEIPPNYGKAGINIVVRMTSG
jgi:hypothetical protein